MKVKRIVMVVGLMITPVSKAGKPSSMWEGFSEQLKATLPLVLATSTSNVVVQAILPPVTQLLAMIVATCSFAVRIGQKGFNRACNRPNSLCVSEVHSWEQIIENIIGTLCEQSISGTIMLKNIPRVIDDEQEDAQLRDNWGYYVQFVSQMFEYVAASLERKIPYYTTTKNQQALLVFVAHSLSLEDRQGIVFMITIIVGNIRHMVAVCAQAERLDDLDHEHLKKISRNTLLMLKKLREMIGGGYEQKNMVGNSSLSGMGGQTAGKIGGF